MRKMKIKYSQSIPSSLFTGIKSSFKFREGVSVVNILSKKFEENPDFNKPLKDVVKL
jgi:hypothetical protein